MKHLRKAFTPKDREGDQRSGQASQLSNRSNLEAYRRDAEQERERREIAAGAPVFVHQAHESAFNPNSLIPHDQLPVPTGEQPPANPSEASVLHKPLPELPGLQAQQSQNMGRRLQERPHEHLRGNQRDLEIQILMGDISAQEDEIKKIHENIEKNIAEPMMELFRDKPDSKVMEALINRLDIADSLHAAQRTTETLDIRKEVYDFLRAKGVDIEEFKRLRTEGKKSEIELTQYAQSHERGGLVRDIRENIQESIMKLFEAKPDNGDMRALLDRLDIADDLYADNRIEEALRMRQDVYNFLKAKGVDIRKFKELRTIGKKLETELSNAEEKLNGLNRRLEGELSGSYLEKERQALLAAGPAAQHRAKFLGDLNTSNSGASKDTDIDDLRKRVNNLNDIIEIDNDILNTRQKINNIGNNFDTHNLNRYLVCNNHLTMQEQRRAKLIKDLSIESMYHVRKQHQKLEEQLKILETPRDS